MRVVAEEGGARGGRSPQSACSRDHAHHRSRRELSNGGVETSVDPNPTPVLLVLRFLIQCKSMQIGPKCDLLISNSAPF